MKIEIIDILAEQTVKGKNYAFLAYVSPIAADINSNKHLAVVTINSPTIDGEGAKVISIETLF